MKQNPALRVLRKVKATNLREGNVEYFNLAKPTESRGVSGSGSDPISMQQPPAEVSTVGVSHTDSDLAGSLGDLNIDVGKNYVVNKLSETDEVRPYPHLCPLLKLTTSL
jgi:hypothetical protein